MNDERLDSASLSKLRWRCRRGLLENDLLDLLLERKQPEAEMRRPEVIEVLGMLRVPRHDAQDLQQPESL